MSNEDPTGLSHHYFKKGSGSDYKDNAIGNYPKILLNK